MFNIRFCGCALLLAVAVPYQAIAHCAGKHTGSHPHCSGDGDDGGDPEEYSGSAGVQFIPGGVAGFDYYIIGTTGADTITAGSGQDLIEGGDGADNIQALGGDDEVHGESGDDIISGGSGNDAVYGGFGEDSIGSESGNNLLDGGPDNDMVSGGDGNDLIYGGSGDDQVGGGDGTDVIYGEGGNDDVLGLSYTGTSLDEMHGGEGCDTFIFNRAFGTATIMDYGYPFNEPVCDLIHFRYESFFRADPSDVEINTVGNDIVIDIWIKKGGGVGGTVILKDAVTNGITLDVSDISFEPE